MDNILDQEIGGHKRDMAFYRDFIRQEDAVAFAQFLDEAGIAYSLEIPETLIDKVIVGEGFVPKAILKIAPDDFERVNALLAEQVTQLSEAEIEAHPLNDLNDKELIAILTSQEEWTVEDVTVAQRLLILRGIPVDDAGVQKLRKERLASLRQGKAGNRWLMLLYALGIIVGPITSIVFLIAGVGMSYYYAYGTTVDADGERHSIYDAATRQLGKVMLYGGAALLVVLTYWFLTNRLV
ncbi:MAG: hypothetical protein AAGJ82_11240 [Bacteroidota bacterium]